MRRVVPLFLVLLMLLVFATPLRAAEFGTREEAVAMVKRVQAKVKKDGLEATFRAINSGSREFNDRDLYAYMVDFTGTNRANAATPAVTGKNIIDLKDQDGKFIIRDVIAIARDQAHGWMDYRWLNPVTKTSRPISSAWVPTTSSGLELQERAAQREYNRGDFWQSQLGRHLPADGVRSRGRPQRRRQSSHPSDRWHRRPA